MNLWLTKDELEVLRECLKITIEQDGELLKDVFAYSHGDWLKFKFERDTKRAIYRKLREKKVNPIAHIKKIAKRIKKDNAHIPLMTVQHDLAQYLGFLKWETMLEADLATLQKRIDAKPLKKLIGASNANL